MAVVATRVESQEMPSRIGAYLIESVLARGAYGVVYRATTDDGAPIAVKTLHLVEERELESLRREAELLTQLKHPGVVSVVDGGVDRGIPWYAMELIEGGTLADVLAERPPLDRALRLVARLCEPLAFLHGEGIVHRDLKPANVVVRDGDAPVIVDFGLTSQFAGTTGREALQGGGELAGTVAYMSPEQIRAAFVDARSDLYALGCILYEAVTGQPPFRGAPHKILDQHLTATPKPPSELAPSIPAALDELILRLLAKDARGRPGFADDVRNMLNGLRGTADRPPAPEARSYLYRPSFVGRAEPMADVIHALQKAERGEGAFLVASGESGVGKTRFAMEAARLATSRRFDVVTATCAVMDAHAAARIEDPLAPLRPLLRAVADRCVAEGREAAERLVGRRAKVLATYEPAFRQMPGFGEQPDPPPLPPDGDRERTLGAVLETVASYLSNRRLLLILDDVQWADDLTIGLLAMLRDGFVHRHPLVVLMACRTEERRPDLDQLLESANVTTLEIARLSAETVKAIVSDMLAMPDPPWNLVRLLERDSRGNPFFIGEYLRGSVEAGFLRRSASGEWRLEATDYIRDPVRGVLPISAGLKNVILRRLAGLDDVTRGFVEAAAAAGREFVVEFAAALGEIPHAQQVSATADLLRRQIVEPVPGGRLRFVHDKLREIAYEEIPATRKVELHRHAAEAIEAAAARNDPTDYSVAALAHHWFVAGETKKASGYFGVAGKRALEAGAYGDAHLHLTKALDLDDARGDAAGPVRRAHWRRMLAVAAYGIGDLESSIRQATEALVGLGEWAPRRVRGWLALALLEVLRRLMAPKSGVDPIGAANPELEHRASEAALASAQLATSYFHRTKIIPTVANLVRSLNRSERAGVDALVVESNSRVAYVAAASRLRGVARRHFGRADEVGRRGTTPRELAVSLYLRAQVATGHGRWPEAQRLAQESIALLDEIGDRSEAEVARAIAAHAFFYSARFAEADALLHDVLRTAQDRGHEQHMAWARFLLGRTQLALGDGAAALPMLQAARPVLVRLQDILSLAMCEGLMSIALWREGDRTEATRVALGLVGRMDRGQRAAVPHAVDGYHGLADAFFAMATDGDALDLPGETARVHRYLQAHSRVFPFSAPLALRMAGSRDWAAGNRVAGLRAWRKAAGAAAQLGMWHEAARSHEHLARFAPDAAEAARSSAIAGSILSSLRTAGCATGPHGVA